MNPIKLDFFNVKSNRCFERIERTFDNRINRILGNFLCTIECICIRLVFDRYTHSEDLMYTFPTCLKHSSVHTQLPNIFYI